MGSGYDEMMESGHTCNLNPGWDFSTHEFRVYKTLCDICHCKTEKIALEKLREKVLKEKEDLKISYTQFVDKYDNRMQQIESFLTKDTFPIHVEILSNGNKNNV